MRGEIAPCGDFFQSYARGGERMSETPGSRKSRWSSAWLWGVLVGVAGVLVAVLASGYMIDATNTDKFCGSCHMMEPFKQSWQASVHGAHEPQGVCRPMCRLPSAPWQFCRLPDYQGQNRGSTMPFSRCALMRRPLTGRGTRNGNRLDFTFDNACHRCHKNLLPPGLPRGGFLAPPGLS